MIKSSSFKVLPQSLAEVFQLECNLKFTTIQSFSKVTDILSVCLASLVPLSVPEIYNAVSALKKEPDSNWQDFVTRFNMLSGMKYFITSPKRMFIIYANCNLLVADSHPKLPSNSLTSHNNLEISYITMCTFANFFPPRFFCKNSVKSTFSLKSYTVNQFDDKFSQWGKISEISTL